MQVPCKAVQPELADWLEEVPEELIAARYLHFLEYEGRACSVEDQVGEFRCMPTRLLEVPCQPMLLPILTVRAQCLLQKPPSDPSIPFGILLGTGHCRCA